MVAGIVRLRSNFSAPRANTPILPKPILLSDALSGANLTDIVGRVSDAGLGGSPFTWVGNAGFLAMTGATITRGAGTGSTLFAGGAAPANDYELSLLVTALPGGSTATITGRRPVGASATTPGSYRLSLATSGSLIFNRRLTDGTTTNWYSGTAAVGDVLALRMVGNQITALKNGVVLDSRADNSFAAGGFFGISGTDAITSLGFKSLIVRSA